MPDPDEVETKWAETNVNSRATLFISGLRSENTRSVAKKIITQLLDNFPQWVRSSKLFNELSGTNPATVTRLLQEMTKQHIIKRKLCDQVKGRAGKAPVFYRIPYHYDPELFLSREELIGVIYHYRAESVHLMTYEAAVKSVIEKKTEKVAQELTDEIDREYDRILDEDMDAVFGDHIELPDPCEES